MTSGARLAIERGVRVRARDGVALATDVYRSPGNVRAPAILLRTPYGRGAPEIAAQELEPLRAVEEGFAVVMQDVRGRFDSEGEFSPLICDARDGVDTIEWIAGQLWSNGRVAMAGSSFNGIVQLLAAAERPRPLHAISPMMTGASFDIWYPGGAFSLSIAAPWVIALALSELERGAEPASPHAEAELYELAGRSPLDQLHAYVQEGSLVRRLARAWEYAITHDTRDDVWEHRAPHFGSDGVPVPSLHVTGWFDVCLEPTLDVYRAGSELPGQGRHLLIGPWTHGLQCAFDERDFGPDASAEAIDMMGFQLDFFRRYLCAADTELPPVRVFVMGANRWVDEDSWPPRGVQTISYYLRSGGSANTRHGDGRLWREPASDDPPDRYLYDPANPVPTAGGATAVADPERGLNAGPRDQGEVEARKDVLVYTSRPLSTPLTVAGSVELELFAASTGTDTDFTAKLVEVFPDGRAVLVCDGIIRASARNGTREREAITPGEVYRYRVRLTSTCHVFAAGHRIRLQVSSSDFPRYYPNPNTSHRLADGPPPRLVPAIQSVFHDRRHPSGLRLQVRPRS